MLSLRDPNERCTVFALCLAAAIPFAAAAPCDILAAANTPCVAAHSTTRAMFATYKEAMYQVIRKSDSEALDITPLTPGGIANAAAQDEFCNKTSCTISIIYDQTIRGNHLTVAPPGGAAIGNGPGNYDRPADASKAPVMLNGAKVYGVYIAPGNGYRNDYTSGIAVGDEPQSIFAVVDGTHYNDQCCFDYGNAEKNNLDNGNGHMEALYFGNCTFWGKGNGPGPWIMADLENGLFAGSTLGKNPGNPTINHRFTAAVVKGKPDGFILRGGDATGGKLSTLYNGKRPNIVGYSPMSKEGAILLGIGGDNSNGAEGTFYEGVITRRFTWDQSEDAIHRDVIQAKYSV